MPTKFPIDYQPGKVQAFLISKETGQMIEATPLTEIYPKPWPIDDIEIETETEPEPPKSLTLSGTFTLKTKMKANQRRKLIRAFSGKQKLPRKLKKACKHIQMVTEVKTPEIQTQDHFFSFYTIVNFRTEDGYPYTKWVRKAIGEATYKLNKEQRRVLEDMVRYTKENAAYLERIMKGKIQ